MKREEHNTTGAAMAFAIDGSCHCSRAVNCTRGVIVRAHGGAAEWGLTHANGRGEEEGKELEAVENP